MVGDQKMAVFDDLKKKDKLLLYPHSIQWKGQIPIANRAEAQSVEVGTEEPLKQECEHFLASVRNRQRPRTDGEEGLRALSVLQRCQEALEGIPRTEAKAVALKTSPKWFAHESAFVDDGVQIGEGTSIWHTSHILKGSRLGKNCKIGQNVVVGPHVTVGNGVKIQNNVSVYEGISLRGLNTLVNTIDGPQKTWSSSVTPWMNELRPTLVKRGATLGANSTILCGITIGRYALVGAGRVVTKDVPDHALVVGNPGRVTGWMCLCGVKLDVKGEKATCPTCGQQYRAERTGMTAI